MANFTTQRKQAWEEISLNDAEKILEIPAVDSAGRCSENSSIDLHETANSTADLVNVSNITSAKQINSHTFLTQYLQPIFNGEHVLSGKFGTLASLKMTAFCLFNAISILYAAAFLKAQILSKDITEDKLKYFVFLGYSFNDLLYRCCFFGVVYYYKHTEVWAVMQTMKSWKSINETGVVQKLVIPFVCCLYVTSACTGFLWSILEAASSFGWEIDEIILYHSYTFSLDTLNWKQLNDTTEFITSYGTNITATTLLLASAGIMLQTFASIQANLISDISLVLALSMYHFANDFEHSLTNESCNLKQIWENFKKLREISKKIDQSFGLLLQLLHIEYLLFCAYFLFSHVVAGSCDLLTILHVVYLLKLLCFYVISSKASTVNSKFRNWLRVTFPGGSTEFFENSTSVATITILDELSTDPIGVGSSIFFIDKAFIWKFISVVGSYFLFFAKSADDD